MLQKNADCHSSCWENNVWYKVEAAQRIGQRSLQYRQQWNGGWVDESEFDADTLATSKNMKEMLEEIEAHSLKQVGE